jgi:hypothetical protein
METLLFQNEANNMNRICIFDKTRRKIVSPYLPAVRRTEIKAKIKGQPDFQILELEFDGHGKFICSTPDYPKELFKNLEL